MPMPGEPFLFMMIPSFIFIIFAVALVIIIYNVLRGLREWHSNNGQPVYAEPALIKDKRTHIWGGGGVHRHNNMHHSHTRTSYYITFEFEDGERREFMVSGQVYGQIAPGDTGTVTYQGTRFNNFERVPM